MQVNIFIGRHVLLKSVTGQWPIYLKKKKKKKKTKKKKKKKKNKKFLLALFDAFQDICL
jgi:hypothetical protein